jgi:hypothetical protein
VDDGLHNCPGGCEKRVSRRHFACSACWHRLPHDLREAISSSWWARDHGAHSIAMTEAMLWYRAEAEPACDTSRTLT